LKTLKNSDFDNPGGFQNFTRIAERLPTPSTSAKKAFEQLRPPESWALGVSAFQDARIGFLRKAGM